MEKRVFIAIILSILILYGYQGIFLKKGPVQKPFEETQTTERKELIVDLQEEKILEQEKSQPADQVKEEIFIFETDTLLFNFTNIGGILKSVTIKQHNETLPVENFFSTSADKDSAFILENYSQNKIIYSLTTEKGKIRKIYDLSRQDYQFNFELEVKNLSEMSKIENLTISPFTINTEKIDEEKDISREKNLFEYSFLFNGVTTRKSNAFKFSSKDEIMRSGSLDRFAFRNRYFCAIVKTDFPSKEFYFKAPNTSTLISKIQTESFTIYPSSSESFSFFVYFGPQNIIDMKEYDQGFEEVVAFSRFGLMDFISKLIIKILHFIHRFIPNWGLAIILVSLLVYGAMYPLTIKGMISMKKMQSLQPEIVKIREKNKNNPKKMNQEVMELYKSNSVNPFSGCFPFILQMPVFIALYQALWRSVMFKGEGFLWIKDLSEPDRFRIPFSLPNIGNEINILPILMIVIMFFQQKFSSRNMVVTDPNQIMQQKMMLFAMPLFMGFIFYKFASGLTLYFTVFYILSTLSQWQMSKMKMGS